MLGHPTPKGVFTIIGRERYHRSNIYSAAVHAAHHMVGHRHASRRRSRSSGLARLHPAPRRVPTPNFGD
jgi:hypothetical protein